MRDEKQGDEAIRDLDRREWGSARPPRPLRVEWAKKTEEPNAARRQQPSRVA